MKIPFWSAFAMSLIIFSTPVLAQSESLDDFAGLESELKPELRGHQNFSPRNLHGAEGWNVKAIDMGVDAIKPNKGHSYSLMDWKEGHKRLLSIDEWLVERDLKDKAATIRFDLRDKRQHEHVGKVLQCRGTCEVYRGLHKARVQHLSRINEGDELKTDADSVAWIYLMDGSLVRLGPLSAVSFQEMNISKNEIFHMLRIHQGHIFWHPRSKEEFPVELSPETDAISLPLLVRNANQTHFERILFQSQIDAKRSEESANLEDTAITEQIKKINELKSENNKASAPETRVMMIAPNGSLVAKQTSFDLVHVPGGKSYFKKRHSSEGHSLAVHLRGYTKPEPILMAEESWHEIDPTGRSSIKVEPVIGPLDVTELLTRRIKSLELAREIWFQSYTVPILRTLNNPKQLALDHGYILWGDELERRIQFLTEYSRRIETTNLKSMENLLKKLEANGEIQPKEISDNHYRSALSYYLRGLKNRYTNKRMQLREMNDLQYYVWILRHGKKQN